MIDFPDTEHSHIFYGAYDKWGKVRAEAWGPSDKIDDIRRECEKQLVLYCEKHSYRSPRPIPEMYDLAWEGYTP